MHHKPVQLNLTPETHEMPDTVTYIYNFNVAMKRQEIETGSFLELPNQVPLCVQDNRNYINTLKSENSLLKVAF